MDALASQLQRVQLVNLTEPGVAEADRDLIASAVAVATAADTPESLLHQCLDLLARPECVAALVDLYDIPHGLVAQLCARLAARPLHVAFVAGLASSAPALPEELWSRAATAIAETMPVRETASRAPLSWCATVLAGVASRVLAALAKGEECVDQLSSESALAVVGPLVTVLRVPSCMPLDARHVHMSFPRLVQLELIGVFRPDAPAHAFTWHDLIIALADQWYLPELRNLDLARNALADSALLMLVERLYSRPRLVCLDLSWNALTDTSLQQLAHLLDARGAHGLVTSVDLRWLTGTTAQGRRAVEAAAQRHQHAVRVV